MLDKEILIELQEYVEGYLTIPMYGICHENIEMEDMSYSQLEYELEDFVKTNQKPSFSQVLFGFIDQKGMTDSSIYKKAGIDRRHFSKIRSNPNYRLGRNSAIALALALELNKKETNELLSSAGFSLSDSDTFDLVIQFCLEKKIYNLDDVNQALDVYDIKPLK